MRAIRSYGSVRGVAGDRYPYRHRQEPPISYKQPQTPPAATSSADACRAPAIAISRRRPAGQTRRSAPRPQLPRHTRPRHPFRKPPRPNNKSPSGCANWRRFP